MSKFQYLSIKNTIIGWGALIVSMQLQGGWGAWLLMFVAFMSFAYDWYCTKQNNKGAT